MGRCRRLDASTVTIDIVGSCQGSTGVHNYDWAMSERAADLAVIDEVRRARVHAVESARAGRLAEVFSTPGPWQQVYVVKLLDVHPSLGKVAGRRLLDSLSISHMDRVCEVSVPDRSAILRAVGEAR